MKQILPLIFAMIGAGVISFMAFKLLEETREYDYTIDLQKDGSVRIHTDYGRDTTLMTLDSLEEFIWADNL